MIPTPHVVVMGVAGAGKSTVGRLIAERRGVPYADGDEFHSPEAIAKMHRGEPLTDEDRAPWLARIGEWMAAHDVGVLSCSALRRSYRDSLRSAVPDIFFVHLAGDARVVSARVASRADHFMPESLVSSQYAELEPLGDDERGMTIDFALPVDQLVDEILAQALLPASVAQPVVRLRPMTDAEFAPWREIAIRHHAAQVSRATGDDLAAATEDARTVLAKVLPAGWATENMHFFVVIDESEREVGWLWLGPAPQDPAVGFVFDVIIDVSVRGRGYGRATMRVAEQFFRTQGKSRISLDVAGGNDVARNLYESLGYRPTSTSMAKNLDLS